MKILIRTILLIGWLGLTTGCTKRIGPTSVQVVDPMRHYYPILRGQELKVVYIVENTGESPLLIKEVQACCGCEADYAATSDIVLPHKKGFVVLKYNSDKNIGYVEQKIRIYGNILPQGMLEVKYDVHVVPHADYTHDYEELYNVRVEKEADVRKMVDGTEAQKGYYVTLE